MLKWRLVRNWNRFESQLRSSFHRSAITTSTRLWCCCRACTPRTASPLNSFKTVVGWRTRTCRTTWYSRAVMKIAVARAENSGRSGPLMMVCPSGVHRCGTFAALNILIERLMAEKRVCWVWHLYKLYSRIHGRSFVERTMIFWQRYKENFCFVFWVGMDETLSTLRSQRYGCVVIYDHYKVLHELLVRQAVSFGMVHPGDVGGKKKWKERHKRASTKNGIMYIEKNQMEHPFSTLILRII